MSSIVVAPHTSTPSFWAKTGCYLVLIFLFSGKIYAQNTVSKKTDTLPDRVLNRELVIQSTRTKAKDPVPHTNLSAEKIREQLHAQDIPMLLGSSVPSLVENSDAGTGTGYTGMRIRGSDQTRINVTLNGIPLNDAEGQGVFWVNLPDLANSAAEIQVQRGVGSSTNGAGAFGASVHIDLNKTETAPFAEVNLTAGSFQTFRQSARFGTGLLANGVFATGRLSAIQSDGWVQRSASDLKAWHLHFGKISAKNSISAHILDGNERTYQAWYGLPVQLYANPELRNYNVAGTERPDSPYPDEADNYRQRHHLLHFNQELPFGLSLQLNGHYTRGQGYYEQYKADEAVEKYGLQPVQIGGTTVTETDLVRQLWLDNHFYGGTYSLRWKPSINPAFLEAAPEMLLGGGLHRYQGAHFGEIVWAALLPETVKGFRYYDNDATKTDVNTFFKTTLPLKKGFSAFADLQVRTVRYQFVGLDRNLQSVEQVDQMTFFNPKIGLTKRLKANQGELYAFAGIGNREPNRDDYTESTPDSRPIAEKLYNLETGYRKTWKNKGFVAANIFYMQYQNQLILTGRINDVGAYTRTNVARSYRAGVELEAFFPLSQKLSVGSNLALSQNRALNLTLFTDDWDSGAQIAEFFPTTDLAFSPAIIGNIEGIWDVFTGKIPTKVRLNTKYVGKQYLDNSGRDNVALPHYLTADFHIMVGLEKWLKTKEASLLFSLINLPGRNYVPNGWAYRYATASFDPSESDPYTRRESGDTYTQIGYFPQAGRRFMLSLNVKISE